MTSHPPAGTPSGIVLEHVTKRFGRTEVLTDISAVLPPGRIYGLLGANGVGKTTLMSVVCNHTFPLRRDRAHRREDPRRTRSFSVGPASSARTSRTTMPSRSATSSAPCHGSTRLGRRAGRAAGGPLPPAAPHHVQAVRGQPPPWRSSSRSPRGRHTPSSTSPYLGLDASARGIFDELLLAYSEHPRTIVMSTPPHRRAAGLLEGPRPP